MVTNTQSPLFKLGSTWYFLAAGRWFTTTDLDKGPWAFATKLPDAFAAIPADHPQSAVRAAVPGTVEAKMAALEVSLPRTTRVRSGSAPAVEITYAGSPEFETIPGTQVARAVNSGFDVFLYSSAITGATRCVVRGRFSAGPGGAPRPTCRQRSTRSRRNPRRTT